MIFSNVTATPTELTVVGENRENPEQLLLQAEDGNYYAFSLSSGNTLCVEPDDQWNVESDPARDVFT